MFTLDTGFRTYHCKVAIRLLWQVRFTTNTILHSYIQQIKKACHSTRILAKNWLRKYAGNTTEKKR